MIIECPTISCQKMIVISEIDHILKDVDSAKEFINYILAYSEFKCRDTHIPKGIFAKIEKFAATEKIDHEKWMKQSKDA